MIAPAPAQRRRQAARRHADQQRVVAGQHEVDDDDGGERRPPGQIEDFHEGSMRFVETKARSEGSRNRATSTVSLADGGRLPLRRGHIPN